jgi:Co/Zn/Cd efflux system component
MREARRAGKVKETVQKTTFTIPKMDCPSEENLLRVKLDGMPGVKRLDFDLADRRLTVFHDGRLEAIESSIADLNLGGRRLSTEESEPPAPEDAAGQRRLLRVVLAINFAFFAIEMATGLVSRSMGLVADSLDMLADSFVYAIGLFAVGGTAARKRGVARLAGYFQLVLAVIGFVEVLRRFFGAEAMPDFWTMIVVSALALVANGTCLYLLQRSKSEEAHMRATMIFTSNDVIINLGVITAGILVSWLNSNKPDLIVGAIVFVVVIRGAIKILKLGR